MMMYGDKYDYDDDNANLDVFTEFTEGHQY